MLAPIAPSLRAEANGNSSIHATVLGDDLRIETWDQFAGAVSALWWRNKQFVNHSDHGREIQTAAQFFSAGECYNPNEAGSQDDWTGPTSSSYLSWLTASGNRLESQTFMAWWLKGIESSIYCTPPNPTPPARMGDWSDYQLHKTVTIGFQGISNVIEYLTAVWIPYSSPNAQIQPIAVVLEPDFGTTWTYDLVSKGYRAVRLPGGEDDSIKVRSTADGNYALGFYSPEFLQPYRNGADGGFGWGCPVGVCASLGSLSRIPNFNAPGYASYRSYLVVGNKAEVKAGLDSLHYQFRVFDPDVFNYKEYVAMNGLQGACPTIDSAEGHWQNYGISEGRTASKTFSPSQYLQLNTDVALAYGSQNYQAAIDHYMATGRNEGRSTVARASCGNAHSMVFVNRRVKAAGNNGSGQFGTGNSTSSSTPVFSTALDNVTTEVAAGQYTSFAVKSDGTVWMWGSNSSGARGDGTTGTIVTTPVPVVFPATELGPTRIATPLRGGKHAVAIGGSAYAAVDTTGQVWTWGENWNGRLGDGTTTAHYTPKRVKKPTGEYLTGIVSIAIGGSSMAALDADANIWTWGAGANGTLGNGSTQDSASAVQVLSLQCVDHDGNPQTPCVWQNVPQGGFSQVACGFTFCVGMTRWGGIFGWGNNTYGQLGTSEGGVRTIASLIPNFGGIKAIAAGSYHALAVHENGNVYGWGYNGYGQLGIGNTATQTSPVIMHLTNGMNNIDDVAAGDYFSLMIRNSDRAVFGTGYNSWGQLGIAGVTATQYEPRQSNF